MTDSQLKVLALAAEFLLIGFIVGVLIGFYVGKKSKR